MFETAIPHSSLKDGALKMKRKIGGNPPTLSTPSNHYKISEKPKNQEVKPKNPLAGPGKPPKYGKPVEPYSCAMQMARIAISQLSRITKDDPKRGSAFQAVKKWSRIRAITLHGRGIINDLV
jgi:hypothetical protein